ncbi:MAG: endonuclease III [Candidatus Omnitrophota bacterium]
MGNVTEIIKLIANQAKTFNIPYVTALAQDRDPYRVLISCILSLRTKDKVTARVSSNLFRVADDPYVMHKLKLSVLRKLIYPVGFYRNKAKVIRDITTRLVNEYDGRVPHARAELLAFKGVGRKTANLLLGLCFKTPAICVDTHVHRISNRLGWVRTNYVYDTEHALELVVPKCYWIRLNALLVSFGQHVCVPISPYCSCCTVNRFCKKEGIKRCR